MVPMRMIEVHFAFSDQALEAQRIANRVRSLHAETLVMQPGHGMKKGDIFTIAGVYETNPPARDRS